MQYEQFKKRMPAQNEKKNKKTEKKPLRTHSIKSMIFKFMC